MILVFYMPTRTSSRPWIGHDRPSLEADDEELYETATVDLPNYDLRKLLTTRDNLCSVEAFNVAIRVIVAQLYGLRMCPEVPTLLPR